MARLNARWYNFTKRGQKWTHFWQDTGVGGPQSLTHVAPQITFTGGVHSLLYTSANQAIGVLYPPTPPFRSLDHELVHLPAEILFVGGVHSLVLDTSVRDEEEALLVLV